MPQANRCRTHDAGAVSLEELVERVEKLEWMAGLRKRDGSGYDPGPVMPAEGFRNGRDAVVYNGLNNGRSAVTTDGGRLARDRADQIAAINKANAEYWEKEARR